MLVRQDGRSDFTGELMTFIPSCREDDVPRERRRGECQAFRESRQGRSIGTGRR